MLYKRRKTLQNESFGRQRFPFSNALWFRPKTESDWLRLRETDVTATESAALFGVSPYATPYELFHVKAGNLKVDFKENARMLWGKRLQRAIADGICADHGWKILSAHPFLYVKSQHYVGMGASPDFIVQCPERGIGFLSIADAAGWRATAPPQVEIEIQHTLEASGLSLGAIGGLIGGNEPKVFVRERDREVGSEIGNRVTDLWRRVRDNDPPGADYLKDAAAIGRAFAARRDSSPLLTSLLRTPVGNQPAWVPRKRAA